MDRHPTPKRWSLRPGCAATALAAALTLAVTAGIAEEAAATTVLKMDLERLSVDANTIVLGRVERARSRWEGTRIVTDVDVRVVIPVKGGAGVDTVLTVRRLGGTVGELRQWVPGESNFAQGEQVLLFLDKVEVKAASWLVTTGMAQGKWSLATGADGHLYGVRDLSELSLAEIEEDAQGNRQVVRIEEGSALKEGAVALDDLLADIARNLQRHNQAPRPELLQRLGADLGRRYDFRVDFDAVNRIKPAATEVKP